MGAPTMDESTTPTKSPNKNKQLLVQQQQPSPRLGMVKKFFRRSSRSASTRAGESSSNNNNNNNNNSPVKSPRRRGSRPPPPEQLLPTIVLPETADDQQGGSENMSPKRERLFQWQDAVEAQEMLMLQSQKQLTKTRDGFCRRVDDYDGQVLTVEGRAVYELGNYLGGGVAGVVYEGHRLRPMEDYPVRLGRLDSSNTNIAAAAHNNEGVLLQTAPPIDRISVQSFLCLAADPEGVVEVMNERVSSMLTDDGTVRTNRTTLVQQTEEMALEATASTDRPVLIDTIDAPSRSKHYTKAIMHADAYNNTCSDASFTAGLMEETVAIKILNPVGFRTLAPNVTETAVVARRGDALTPEMAQGKRPMEERHVWWLVNPNSRNLRTLQRYSGEGSRRVEVDRGTTQKGLRISLIAAFQHQGQLKELPLTRCIEIWGHVPFATSDNEFKQLMIAIDKINQGQPPPALPLWGEETVPGRVGTGGSSFSGSLSEELKSSSPMATKRTGIYRAASTDRKTVYCSELKAYIALPAVPSKYLKWLRQRRAATKEIRNMMLIGRHHNVVHLFEVLEFIQDTKSTMFLILELVRGGELFDLISSNSARISNSDTIPKGFTESETVMRKFFRELASGVYYCHSNGIAHRDLKPENLLVHNGRDGDCTLKIADFGLSAAFGPNSQSQTDMDTVVESLAPSASMATLRIESSDNASVSSAAMNPVSPLKDRLGTALSFLTCGAMEDFINCRPTSANMAAGPSPLKRMTSVVGSPHYVAPEIISQHETRKKGDALGYDGTKADVWSAGVILYAMLFRSLPFGEDLLRCPRYQSFKKWYDEVKKVNGRRSTQAAALDPIITEVDERDFLGPHWFFPSRSSPESRDLIVYMLNPDPDARPSIQLVLQHPWLLKQ